MKKFGLLLSVLLVGSTAAFGVEITAACATQTNVTGYTCDIGDKTFSNFTGSLSGGSVSFTQITATQYGLTYTAPAGGLSALTFGFTVAVNGNPGFMITQITDQMNTVQAGVGGQLVPNASMGTVTHTPGGVVQLNAAGNGSGQSGAASMFTPSETISFTYAGNGLPGNGVAGVLTSMEFRISQSAVPEPMTLSMMGLGLLGLGLFGRKRMVK